jgi:type IV secretory pathway ATPase VirB11/archaellum biosynthesis ATPase
MRRRDREVIDIGECTPLEAVLERLQALRGNLSDEAQPIVKVSGDDNFGWRLTVTYFRETTAEEAEIEARYAS